MIFLNIFQKIGRNIKEAGTEIWKGRYEQEPIYAKNADGSYVTDAKGKLAPPIGSREVYDPGLQSYIRDPEKVAKKGLEYGVDQAQEFLNPQTYIQREIDDITGLHPEAQITYIQEQNTIPSLVPLDPNTGLLPELVTNNTAVSSVNHMNNINNNKWYSNPSMFEVQFPGYVRTS